MPRIAPLVALLFASLALVIVGIVSAVTSMTSGSRSGSFPTFAATLAVFGGILMIYSLGHLLFLWIMAYRWTGRGTPREEPVERIERGEHFHVGSLVINPVRKEVDVRARLAEDILRRQSRRPGVARASDSTGLPREVPDFGSGDITYAIPIESVVPCASCLEEGRETWVCRSCGRGCPKGHVQFPSARTSGTEDRPDRELPVSLPVDATSDDAGAASQHTRPPLLPTASQEPCTTCGWGCSTPAHRHWRQAGSANQGPCASVGSLQSVCSHSRRSSLAPLPSWLSRQRVHVGAGCRAAEGDVEMGGARGGPP